MRGSLPGAQPVQGGTNDLQRTFQPMSDSVGCNVEMGRKIGLKGAGGC